MELSSVCDDAFNAPIVSQYRRRFHGPKEFGSHLHSLMNQHVLHDLTIDLVAEPCALGVMAVWLELASVTPVDPYASMSMKLLRLKFSLQSKAGKDRLDARMKGFTRYSGVTR